MEKVYQEICNLALSKNITIVPSMKFKSKNKIDLEADKIIAIGFPNKNDSKPLCITILKKRNLKETEISFPFNL